MQHVFIFHFYQQSKRCIKTFGFFFFSEIVLVLYSLHRIAQVQGPSEIMFIVQFVLFYVLSVVVICIIILQNPQNFFVFWLSGSFSVFFFKFLSRYWYGLKPPSVEQLPI
jgi:ABC-type Fe3+-siderophore transport system permease subunit